MKAVKNQGANKDAKIYVGRSTTVHNILFFAHTLRYPGFQRIFSSYRY